MKSFGIAFVAALALVASLNAQQTPAKPADAPKTLTGKWDMNVAIDQGPLNVLADIKQDGTKLTGTLNSQMGNSDLTGEVKDDKITFKIQFDGGNGSMEISFAGTIKPDGTLAGTMTSQMGEVTWTATRSKSL